MRRRRGLGLFGFIIILAFLDLLPGMLITLLPVAILGVIGVAIYKIIQLLTKTDSPKSNYYNKTTVKQNTNTSIVKPKKYEEIDKVLSKYFSKNVALVLFDDVSVCIQGGTYSTVENLYVCYKDEKICQLKEFKDNFPSAYERVLDALYKLAKSNKSEKVNKKEEKKAEEVKPTVNNNAFSAAEKFIDEINSLNKDIANEEVTNGLYQTCDLLKQIDIVDREDGQVDPKLNKLYEYYLPILTGILNDYKRLSESPVKGDEFKKCETQLVKTVKLINEALKTIYGSLHEADYMNLNADINTLQSLLKQDGLVDTPFKGDK